MPTFPSRLRQLTPRSRLALLLLAGGFVLYAALGFLLVPALLKAQVRRQARAALHREATLAGARFNPFTLEARLAGLDLRDRDGTPLAAFDTLVVNLSVSSAWHRALVLDEFRLVRPALVVRILPDGRPAVADLMRRDTAAAADTLPADPPRLLVHRLAIRDGELGFVDESRSPRYEERFRDLGLSVEGLSTLPDRSGDHVLTATFASGAEVRWTGTSSVDPLELTGRFEFSRVPLPRLAQVLGRQPPVAVVRGSAEAMFRYEVRQDNPGGVVATVPEAGLVLTDLAVRPRGDGEEMARVARVDVEGVTAEWPARRAGVARVRVTAPWAAARRLPDGTSDWAAVMAAFPADTAPAPALPAWAVRVEAVEVADGALQLRDESVSPAATFEVTDLALRAAPVGTDSTVPVVLELTAGLGGATLAVRGEAVRAPLGADLAIELAGLDLRQARPWLGANPPATLAGGRASLAGRARVREGRPRMTFDGRAAVSGFALNDSAGEPLLAWRTMQLTGVHYRQAPDLLRVTRIVMQQPFARIAVARDKTVNLMALATMLPAASPEERIPYEIGEVVIRDASVDFSDESLILPFRTRIDSARGVIRDLASFGGTPGSLELEGKIEEYGLARASGTLLVGDPFQASTIGADFRNVEMRSLTPYSAQFAGYAIERGRLDVDVDYRIQDRMLEAEHRIVMTDLTLGEKVEGGESPGFLVKLAVSLLKDDEGRITLDVPVEGSVDDPQFDYGAMVWGGVKTILGRIATAPFRFLGNLLGIGGEDVELVDFEPGRTDIIPPEREKLDSLAAELGRKPELVLSVEGRYDSISDAAALREARLAALVQARRDSLGGQALTDTSTTMLARILQSLYEGEFGQPGFDSLRREHEARQEADTARARRKFDPAPFYREVRERLLAAQPVAPGELERLGAERGAAVAAAMLAGGTLDTTRVSATPPAPVKRKKQGSPRVPSELALDAP